MTPLFLDANVPMYAAGVEHPLRDPCASILEIAADHPQTFMTDAEVLQEILHRYLAQNRREQGTTLVLRFSKLMTGRVESVTADDVVYAAEAAASNEGLSARDLVHAAVMSRIGATQIVSADTGFDRITNIERLAPENLQFWAPRFGLA